MINILNYSLHKLRRAATYHKNLLFTSIQPVKIFLDLIKSSIFFKCRKIYLSLFSVTELVQIILEFDSTVIILGKKSSSQIQCYDLIDESEDCR